MHDPHEEEGGRGRIDVRDEIRRVDADGEGHDEQEQSGEACSGSEASAEALDASVGEEEAELLEGHPDEEEVQEAQALDAGDASHDIDRDRCNRQSADRP